MGQTFDAPGISDCVLMAIALSNADENAWWAICIAGSSPASGMVIVASSMLRQGSTFIFASATIDVDGDSARVRSGTVMTGPSIAGMTTQQPLHIRKIVRLL